MNGNSTTDVTAQKEELSTREKLIAAAKALGEELNEEAMEVFYNQCAALQDDELHHLRERQAEVRVILRVLGVDPN